MSARSARSAFRSFAFILAIFGTLSLIGFMACDKNSDDESEDEKSEEAKKEEADDEEKDGDKKDASTLEGLSGEVVIDGTSDPLADADVYVLGSVDDKTTTDESGSFVLAIPEEASLLKTEEIKVSIVISKADDKEPYGKKLDDVVLKKENLGTIKALELGKISGKFLLHGKTDHVGIDVYIPGTSFSAKTDHDGKYTISYVPAGTWASLRADYDGYKSKEMEQIEVASKKTTELEEFSLAPSTGAEGTFTINEGATTSIDLTVTLNFEYTEDNIKMIVSDDPQFIGANWENVTKTKSWTFETPGLKKLYVKYRDKDGFDSAPRMQEITVGNVTPEGQVVAVSFYPPAGSFDSDQNITLTTATEGATIYYTIDTSTPSTNSIEYTGPVAITGFGTSKTIKAIAIKDDMKNSDISAGVFEINSQAATTTFSPVAGHSFSGNQTITIATTTTGATIYYTTDGTDPSTSSSTYSSPIAISCNAMTDVVIKTLVVKTGLVNSSIGSATYGFSQCPLIIYQTPVVYDGALGGRGGANSKCLAEKPDEIVCNGIAAFISIDSSDKLTNLPTNEGFDGTQPVIGQFSDNVVKSSFNDLVSATPNETMSDATGVSDEFWTGSTTAGGEAENCSGWTSSNIGEFAKVGDYTVLDVSWKSKTTTVTCMQEHPLLCICY